MKSLICVRYVTFILVSALLIIGSALPTQAQEDMSCFGCPAILERGTVTYYATSQILKNKETGNCIDYPPLRVYSRCDHIEQIQYMIDIQFDNWNWKTANVTYSYRKTVNENISLDEDGADCRHTEYAYSLVSEKSGSETTRVELIYRRDNTYTVNLNFTPSGGLIERWSETQSGDCGYSNSDEREAGSPFAYMLGEGIYNPQLPGQWIGNQFVDVCPGEPKYMTCTESLQWKLGQIPITCPPITDLAAWSNLISFRPPVSIQTSIKSHSVPAVHTAPIFPDLRDTWFVQPIEDGKGQISLDYYPIIVSRLPTVSGSMLSAEEVLLHVRRNLNIFVNDEITKFSPYDASVDNAVWLSTSPEGAVIHIDMKAGGGINVDDGSVVVAEASPDHWVFSTVWTGGDLGHPLNGIREFGFQTLSDGNIVFYTRAADRPSGYLDWFFADAAVFPQMHALWQSLQQKIADFVNSNQGLAQTSTPISCRYDWASVQPYYNPVVPWIEE